MKPDRVLQLGCALLTVGFLALEGAVIVNPSLLDSVSTQSANASESAAASGDVPTSLPSAASEPEPTNSDTPVPSSEYVDAPKYDHDPIDRYIEFKTAYAERTVRGFMIDCPGGKKMSLMKVLRAAASMGASEHGGLYETIDSRGTEVRVYHQVRFDDGRSNDPHVVMTLNEWGDLQLTGIREEAVMNLCFY